MIDYIEPLIEGINDLISNPKMIIMWIISGLLFYVGIYKKKEPLLLVPISSGILLANLPMGELIRIGGNGEPDGFLRIFQNIGMTNDLLPLLIFLGMGALTDFEPVLSNPKTLLLGAAAQIGVFAALLGALFISMTPFFDFGLLEAASIGIIGGADGYLYVGITNKGSSIYRLNQSSWEKVSFGLDEHPNSGIYEMLSHTDFNLYASNISSSNSTVVYKLDEKNYYQIK